MKKQVLVLLILMAAALSNIVQAQDSIPGIIISEWRGDGKWGNYIEFANVGDTAVDMSSFTWVTIANSATLVETNGIIYCPPGGALGQYRFRNLILGPGEAVAIMLVSDALQGNGTAVQSVKMLERCDIRIHGGEVGGTSPADTLNPAMELWGGLYPEVGPFDSVDVGKEKTMLYSWYGWCPDILIYHRPGGDSLIIDAVNLDYSSGLKVKGAASDVAGYVDATWHNTLVRKAVIKRGNPDFTQSRGVSSEDSEWLVLPQRTGYEAFTTVGTHGDFKVDVTSSTVDVNKEAATMTVPWGVRKGDSLIQELDLGPGMAWLYVEDTTSVEDSAHTIVQTGDILTLFACGNTLDRVDFRLTAGEPTNDMALVFPLRSPQPPEMLNNPAFPGPVWAGIPFYVTDEDPVIDTVGNVSFNLRVDSLFRYLEKAPKASWEIIWVDGVERADLKYGDILRVTAENGTTKKDYFIDVQEYEPSDNAFLGAITWPDKEEFLEGWQGDTIPLFAPDKQLYTLTLPYGSTTIPSLVAKPQSTNARITVQRGINLKGSLAQRTTVFQVMAEDDSTYKEYSVVFEVEKEWEKVQKYYGDPFFSEFVTKQNSWLCFVEIVNPRNIPVDLSQYIIVRSPGISAAEALTDLRLTPTEANFKYRYRSFVPGYKYYDDTTEWMANVGILQQDPAMNPVLEPGEVFLFCSANANRQQYLKDWQRPLINKSWFSAGNLDELGTQCNSTVATVKYDANGMFIFKILNDSVLEGLKPVGDPMDYQVVDAFGDPDPTDNNWVIGGRTIIANQNGGNIRRKPNVYKGALNIGDGIGDTITNSDWTVQLVPSDIPMGDASANVGSHAMNVVTVYLSTVSSTAYLVSDGYVSPQSIQGDLASTTVEQFFALVSKSDPGQSLSVLSGTNGLEKASGDPVAGNDTLKVVSGDGKNTTKYLLINQPLDADAVLKTVNAKSNFTIEIDGSNGVVKGVEYDMLLRDVVDSLIVPALATMHIVDMNNELVPLRQMTYDSVYADTRVGDGISFEVLAQDGLTKITYKLEVSSLSSEAFVVSTVYSVDNDKRVISGLFPRTTVVYTYLDLNTNILYWRQIPFATTSVPTFWNNIEVVKGATATLIDKFGHERTSGLVSFDDKLLVVSEDKSTQVVYYLDFLKELAPDYNLAPEVTVAFADSTVSLNSPTISVSATATDDGMPLPAGLDYKWVVSEGAAGNVAIATDDASATNVTFSAEGSYKLQVTVSDGELSDMAEIAVTVTKSSVGIEGLNEPGISIYPNPASEVMTIELKNMGEPASSVKILDVAGRMVYTNNFNASTATINVGNLPAGMYYVTVKAGNNSFTRKLQLLK